MCVCLCKDAFGLFENAVELIFEPEKGVDSTFHVFFHFEMIFFGF